MSLEKDLKQKKYFDPYEKSVVNIIYTAKLLESRIKKNLVPFEITVSQYNILRILNGSFPKPLSPGEIKEVMLDKGADLTRLLDRLVDKKMVERRVCPSNRRKVDLLISDLGKNTIKNIQPALQQLFKDISKNSSKKAQTQLNEVLDQIRPAIKG